MSAQSIQARRYFHLVLLGIAFALAIIIVSLVLTHRAYQKAEAELIIERDKQVTILSAYRLQSEMVKFSQTLQKLAQSREIQSLVVSEQNSALKRESFRLADFDGGVVILNEVGWVVTSEPERTDILHRDWSDRDYFRKVIGSSASAFSDSVKDGPNGEPVVVICVPILNENGHFIGALAGMFRLGQKTVSPFNASIVRLRLGQSGSLYVVDGKGTILFDSSSSLVGEQFTSKISGLNIEGSSGAMRAVDMNHLDIVASYAKIPGTDWTLVNEDDWAILTSPIQKYKNSLLFLLILATIMPSAGLGMLLVKRNQELTKYAHLENEMLVARHMKQNVLPNQVPVLPGWKLNLYHHPAPRVSGDFFDFMVLPDGRFMLVIGNVPEQGISAITKITTLRAALRNAGQRLLSPAEALQISNSLICPDIHPDYSYQCLYAIFDFTNCNLEYACAGQNSAFIFDGQQVKKLESTGVALGKSLTTLYQQKTITIYPNERLLLCNCGVLGLKNHLGELFSDQPLFDLLLNQNDTSWPVLDRLMAGLRDFMGKKERQEDDILLLLLERESES